MKTYTLRISNKNAFGDFSIETSTSSSSGTYKVCPTSGWGIKYTFDTIRNYKTHTEIREGQKFTADLNEKNELINLEKL